jgi:hypothetical protein
MQQLSHRTTPSSVIQRRAGFEFETGDNNNGAFAFYKDQGDQMRLFADEITIYTTPMWKIVIDGGRMEFVTEPLGSQADINTVTGQIQAFITHAQAQNHNTDLKAYNNANWIAGVAYQSIHVAKNPARNQDVTVTSFYGKPQISVGIRVHKLGEFIDAAVDVNKRPFAGLEARMLGLAQQRIQNDPVRLQAAENTIRAQNMGSILSDAAKQNISASFPAIDVIVTAHSAGMQDFEKKEFKGFLKYIAMQVKSLNTYNEKRWENANNGGAQPKYMKSFFSIMPRTDFHSTYSKLQSGVKTAVRAAQADFVQAFPFSRADTLGYSLNDFYSSIFTPVDQKHGRDVDKATADAPYKIQTDNSLGQLTQDVQDRHKIVHELRHITHVTIPFDFFVTDVFPQVNAWIKTINNE